MKEIQNQKPYLFFCNGKDCRKKRSPELYRELKRCKRHYQVVKTTCMDQCKEAPNFVVGNTRYAKVTIDDWPRIVNKKAVK